MTTQGRQESTDLRRRRHPRMLWVCGGVVTAIIVLAAVVALVLALVVLKPRQLETKLQSVAVEGVSPRVAFPAVRVELNVTLSLVFLVHNPNRAAFDHADGASTIFYHGRQVGDADVSPGRIPSRGSAHLYSRLTVEADRFAADLAGLVRDVLAGRFELDSSTRIPGRVTLLGFIHRHVVVVTDCHIIITFPPVSVASQQCRQKTE